MVASGIGAGRIPRLGCGVTEGELYGHIKKSKNRSKFVEFCRYLRSLHPLDVRIAIVWENYSPHLTTKRCQRVGTWAAANNAEIAYTPTNSSWLNRIEAQLTALRYFALDGTDHPSHKAQGSMIRRYIIWRNKHAADERLREVLARANVACPARQAPASPKVKEAPDVVIAVESPTVHVPRVRFSTRRQRLRQREGLIAETSEASSGMAQAQTGQPEQRAARHGPRPDLQAPVLDELSIVIVQRTPDQSARCLALLRAVTQSSLQRLDHHLVRQRGRVLEAQMRVHPARLRAP
ncbi:hypothetical protein GCM10017688_63080 [Streptomyces ramulosus]